MRPARDYGLHPAGGRRALGRSARGLCRLRGGRKGFLLQPPVQHRIDESPKLKGYILTRAGKGLAFDRRKAYHYEHLAYNFRDKKAEPFIVTVEYDPTGAPKTAHDHEGQEFDYVLTGHMKIVLAGNEVYLGPGDSIYYDSSIPHAMYAVETDCRFIAVVIK